jgi:hypothetical protein
MKIFPAAEKSPSAAFPLPTDRQAGPSSLRRTSWYASLLRISGALHLGIFELPENIFLWIAIVPSKKEELDENI